MMSSHESIILLKNPTRVPIYAINDKIEANTSLGFIHNATQMSVNFSTPMKSSCSGNLCDRQRVIDWLDSKGCERYGISTN